MSDRPGWSLRRRVAGVVRHEGVRGVALRARDAAGIRTLVLLERDLAAAPCVPAIDAGLACRLLSEADVGAVVALRPSLDADAVRPRLDAGDYGIGVWHGDRLISAAWFSTAEAWIPELGRRLRLGPGQVYGYDSFTAPDWRGRGVYGYRSSVAAQVLTVAGLRHSLGFVIAHNRPSLRAAAKAGFRPFGMIGYVRIGRWRRDFVRIDGHRRWVGPDTGLDVLSGRRLP